MGMRAMNTLITAVGLMVLIFIVLGVIYFTQS